MLDAMGYITPEITGKWPGCLSPYAGLKFADVPDGLAAIPGCRPREAGAGSLRSDLCVIHIYVYIFTSQVAAEIANGRWAMRTIIGMSFQ
jgi:hypothetical protein